MARKITFADTIVFTVSSYFLTAQPSGLENSRSLAETWLDSDERGEQILKLRTSSSHALVLWRWIGQLIGKITDSWKTKWN